MQMEPTLPPEENQEQQQAAAAPSQESSPSESTETAAKAPEINVEDLPLEDYPVTLDKILKDDQWMKMGSTVRSLQDSFDQKFLKILQEKKETFIQEGGNEIDFFFQPEYKKHFSGLVREYKNRKSKHFKEQEAAQKANLNRKREIIE